MSNKKGLREQQNSNPFQSSTKHYPQIL